MAAALPTIEVPAADLANGISAVTLFVQSGLVRSNGEARRSIRGGGLRINGTPVSDEKALVGEQDLTDGVVKLSLGRKKHVLVRPG